MRWNWALPVGLILAPAVAACGGSGGSAGGTYISVETDDLQIELGSGGKVTFVARGAGSSSGTYQVEGEKILVTTQGQTHTFIRDGDCIEDQLSVFGKLCKGGKAGAAANVSTRNVPTTPKGTYLASSTEGEFRLEFKAGNTFTLAAAPTGGQRETVEGSFTVEGDVIYATLPQSVPLVLKFVNDGYETTSFGFPLRFRAQ